MSLMMIHTIILVMLLGVFWAMLDGIRILLKDILTTLRKIQTLIPSPPTKTTPPSGTSNPQDESEPQSSTH